MTSYLQRAGDWQHWDASNTLVMCGRGEGDARSYGSAQANDVGMVEQLQDLDLSPHFLVHIKLPDPVSVEDLDRHLVARQLVLCHCTSSNQMHHSTQGCTAVHRGSVADAEGCGGSHGQARAEPLHQFTAAPLTHSS
jgi:hypothetical protein